MEINDTVCPTGKVCYRSKAEATEKIISLSKRKKGKFRDYVCNECGLIHITTFTKIKPAQKEKQKYKIDVNGLKPGKIENHSSPNHNYKTKHQSFHYSKSKLISPEQADFLKKLIEAKKPD